METTFHVGKEANEEDQYVQDSIPAPLGGYSVTLLGGPWVVLD